MEADRPQKNSLGARWLRASGFLLLGSTAFFWPGVAEAQVLTKVGSFVPPTTGPRPQNYSVTGVGFQPKAVIFFWTAQTTPGFANNALVGYGFATGPGSERAVNFLSDDNTAGGTNAKRAQWDNRCVVVTNTSALGTVNAYGSFVSMDADGFTPAGFGAAPGSSTTWPSAARTSPTPPSGASLPPPAPGLRP
jgi:hypothetical protein